MTGLSTARLTIDLAALVANWRAMAALSSRAETSAVVKADAYGIGVGPAVKALADAGCRTFFVATHAEGAAVRGIAANAVIYVLDGLLPGTADAFARHDLRPVLGSPGEIAEWTAWRAAGGPTGSAVQIDTGMNRQGLSAEEAAALAADADALAALAPDLIMSHLACGDDPASPMTKRQLDTFVQLSALFPKVSRSLANSAGTMRGEAYQFDLTRPGIALYGARAANDHAALTPVATAEVPVLRVREASAGETVGYGATETLKRPSRLAVLGGGYADGYLRAAGSSDERPGASVFIRGKRAPLVGRVSMDLMVADVSDVPGVERGDAAQLFGPNVPVDDVADAAGTIGYELLTSLGKRYVRSYVGA